MRRQRQSGSLAQRPVLQRHNDLIGWLGKLELFSNKAPLHTERFVEYCELLVNIQGKRDPTTEHEVTLWISSVLGEAPPDAEVDFGSWLRSGQILCRLMNKLRPDSVTAKSNTRSEFGQIENINGFLHAARAYGVKPELCFQAQDLWEQTNVPLVVSTLVALREVAGQTGSVSTHKVHPS